MRRRIEKAFADFDNGVRPEGYRPPRYWYVLNSIGNAYPAKAIWALATGGRPRSFNTRDARDGLAELDCSLVDSRVCDQSSDFENEINKSLLDTKENRRKRLKFSTKKPTTIFTLTKSYKRNPDVVAEVLLRADGVCERCNELAPFKKKKDSTPYLEIHHIFQLLDSGDDTVENAIALCPNCHREAHYG